MRVLANILAGTVVSVAAFSASNIDPAHSTAQSSCIGELEWRPSSEYGVTINQYFCSGYLYSPNVGWVQLGSGQPKDGMRYRNDSATDFGVNVLPNGALRGFAYGANIGWITFEEQGNPRVNWSTGELHGSIYSANTGFISLDGLDDGVRVNSFGTSPDSDGDGLPDAWEIAHAATLTKMSATTDTDSDGQTDREEFLAGTDPLNAAEMLAIKLHAGGVSSLKTVSWATKLGYLYRLESRASFQPGVLWQAVNSSPLTGTGSEASLNLPANLPQLSFFRVRAFLPLSQVN